MHSLNGNVSDAAKDGGMVWISVLELHISFLMALI